MNLAVRVVGSVDQLDRPSWDGLGHGASPFLRYGFLRALEDSGSITPLGSTARSRTGWVSVYLLAEQAGRLVGGVAAFVKSHSYGEYIFDWGWANASERAGLAYYPKLVIAAPHTPATGHRILLAPDCEDRDAVCVALIRAVRQIADDAECSSVHWLFCTAEEQTRLVSADYLPRLTMQFHWHNRGYSSFNEFLAALKSRKRKQLRKERERARHAVVMGSGQSVSIDRIGWVAGDELTAAHLDDLDRYYRSTVDAHGGSDYLRPGFFHRLAETLPEAMRMVEVIAGGKRIAGALFLETLGGLYGRYWGSDVHVELLHFETAYYSGIERAIERGIPLFEAGAQGEHKLVRGFEPSPIYSAHWIRHPALREAVTAHTRRETFAVNQELASLAALGPYRTAEERGESERGESERDNDP